MVEIGVIKMKHPLNMEMAIVMARVQLTLLRGSMEERLPYNMDESLVGSLAIETSGFVASVRSVGLSQDFKKFPTDIARKSRISLELVSAKTNGHRLERAVWTGFHFGARTRALSGT